MFPATTDRHKAAAILSGMADQTEYHNAITKQAGPVLLQMLKLSQPNNHDFAYDILKKVSKKDYGERNYDSWEKWLKEYQ